MLAAFSITPVGVGEDVGEQVAAAVRVIRESGLPNRTAASFTEIEGDWDEVMAVIKAATDAVMTVSGRCSIVIKADIRPGYSNTLTTKVESVERRLAQQ
ncbi:MTH1187 family thiamine-binding protein [Nocardia sp. CA-128927]|uniref:MTH1187 family thiamine-binding protein n=1 Tax=Nocardia sp. CA-128927 TaxID=3239975 RepID=UPI003D992BA8